MKRTYLMLMAALLFAAGCVSCSEETAEEENSQEQKEEEKEVEEEDDSPKPGLYSFVASPLQGSWVEGDKIYVHGAYGPKAQVVTLSASDISADGKTATANLDTVTELPCAPDGLYAAWPADVVEEETGLQSCGTPFSNAYTLLSVAYLTENTFTFVDATSAISFTVTGDYDSYAIAGTDRQALRITSYEAEHSSTGSNFNRTRTDGYPFREGSLVSGEKTTIWFPGDQNFKKGYSIFFGKDGKWPVVYTVTDALNLSVGTVADLGDITSSLTAYDGPEPRMPEIGKSEKWKVDIVELSGLCLSADGDFLWGVGDEGQLGKLGFDGSTEIVKHFYDDLEGVTLNPISGDLIVCVENSQLVACIPGPDFTARTNLFPIQDAIDGKFYNAGLEGITYYKDSVVYVGSQAGVWLWKCHLRTGEVLEKIKLKDVCPDILEVADFCYDPQTDWLWVADSEAHRLFVFTGDAKTYLGSYSVSGIGNPESVSVDHERSCVWVADDDSSSTLYKFSFTGL